jgi:hypothetical protein
MAGASLLTLLDDIATVLDDVAVLSKVAAKKGAGVLGDDLALDHATRQTMNTQIYGKRYQTFAPDNYPTHWHYPATGGTLADVLLVKIGTPTTTGCTREEAKAALEYPSSLRGLARCVSKHLSSAR